LRDCNSIERTRLKINFEITNFQPGDDYEIVPNSKFVISRTAFKDNSSYYELDKKKVKFNVIAKFLRSHGVDLDHNRFLILQVRRIWLILYLTNVKYKRNVCKMFLTGQSETDRNYEAQGTKRKLALEFLENIIGTSRSSRKRQIWRKLCRKRCNT